MQAEAPPRNHLILAGGGHSHALVLRHWAMQPQRRPRAWITLVSRGSTALYSGMVPGLVAGLYEPEACAIDLRHLAEQAGVSFIAAEITGLDLSQRLLALAGRPPLRFDWLSLDVGAETAPIEPLQSGAATTVLAIKPLEPFLQWCERTPPGQAVRIVGSGAAAVEVALALRARGHEPLVLTRTSGLSLGSRSANQLLSQVLQRAGINRTRAAPKAAGQQEWRQSGAESPARAITLNCSGSRAPAWLKASGLPTGPGGRVLCHPDLTVQGHPGVFASGDCGVIAGNGRPPSGVWAVRAAPVLAGNLQRALASRPLQCWRPQRRALQLLGDGGVSGQPRAMALWGPLALGPSRWLWRWKDQIDRQFMARFAPRPTMTAAGQGASGAAMACRGCAAKVAAAPLAAALQQLDGPAPQRDDAALVARSATGELLLQSVDGFPALVSDPWLNGRLTTLHACSDLWATGAAVASAQTVVTLPVLADPLQADLLLQTLAGVRSVLDPLGAELLGGHTLEARDAMPAGPGMPMAGLSLMLTVNGNAPTERLWPKGPLQRGDALLLLRPIGSGVLFAAAMAGAAKPSWIDGALGVLQHSQAPAVDVLAAHGCHACTDITGFGLLGHLGEMLQASPEGLRVELESKSLRQLALPGALELLAAGHASTLAPANASALTLLSGPVTLNPQADANLEQLLIDPQTCGPLLAALPAAQASGALLALLRAGYPHAAVIGRVAGGMDGVNRHTRR